MILPSVHVDPLPKRDSATSSDDASENEAGEAEEALLPGKTNLFGDISGAFLRTDTGEDAMRCRYLSGVDRRTRFLAIAPPRANCTSDALVDHLRHCVHCAEGAENLLLPSRITAGFLLSWMNRHSRY